MVTMQHAKDGIMSYIDNEILTHLDGWKRTVAAMYVALAADNVVNMIHEHAHDQAVEMLGICDENHALDVDRMREAAMNAIGGNVIEIKIPMIGTMKIDRNDVERLFAYMS